MNDASVKASSQESVWPITWQVLTTKKTTNTHTHTNVEYDNTETIPNETKHND